MAAADIDERLKAGTVDGGAITLSDTVEVKFLDPVEGTTKYCRGFHCNIDGSLAVKFAQSSAAVILAVRAGMYYPYAIKLFMVTNTTVGMVVIPVR